MEWQFLLESASNDLSDSDHSELLNNLTSIKNLLRRDEQVGERLIERRREREIIKRRIHELVECSSLLRERIDQCVNRINGEVGNTSRFSASLHGIENSAPIGDVWGDTQLVLADSISSDRFQNIFPGSEVVRCDERVLVRELLKDFSIAIAYAVG